MSYSIKLFGRVYPEQAAVVIPPLQFLVKSPTANVNDSTWAIYGHGSQLMISAVFSGEERPAIDKVKDIAFRLSLTITNLLGFFALRTFQVEILAADDAETRWFFGADVHGITEATDRVDVDWSLMQKLDGKALRCLQSALDDFRQALTQRERAPMLVHRLLETLAWRYVADEDKASLSHADWSVFWDRVGLSSDPKRAWALSALQPIATRIRHGRFTPEATTLFEPAIALARQVISNYIEAEVVEIPARS
ncbi:hypothetical protein [Variovorax sp. EBFNA2]|uniref:hypothetical protein n=1 Tax=Variovorax sp. EBFNA2 TaxID=3342097 RepID=UPI0029C051A2|nr:hypothetical protein [Variovorax boronicumulans]WPG36730.1 hypothetical protein RZE79_25085 [Variovorax boronicumulans]